MNHCNKLYPSIRTAVFKLYRLFNKQLFVGKNYTVSKTKEGPIKTEVHTILVPNIEVNLEAPKVIAKTGTGIQITPFKLFEKGPQGYTIIKNAIYHPHYHCLYTEEGNRIDTSTYSTKKNYMPAHIDLPSRVSVCHEQFVYVGDYTAEMHFGHFLIEAIGPMHYLNDHPETKVLCHDVLRPFKTIFIDSFYNTLFPGRVFHTFKDITQISSIIVPERTIEFGMCAYQNHKLVTTIVAEKIVRQQPQVPPSNTPIYLSRSGGKNFNRHIIGEIELEAILYDKGVKIVHPEKFSLAQQIILINRHSTIIGCRGSALHAILFASDTQHKKLFIIEDENHIDVSFPMVDAVMGIDSTYIGGLKKTEDKSEHLATRHLDCEFVLAVLKAEGVIS